MAQIFHKPAATRMLVHLGFTFAPYRLTSHLSSKSTTLHFHSRSISIGCRIRQLEICSFFAASCFEVGDGNSGDDSGPAAFVVT